MSRCHRLTVTPEERARVQTYQRGYRQGFSGRPPSETGRRSETYMRGYRAGSDRRDQLGGKD